MTFLKNIFRKLSKPKPAYDIWKDSRYVINYAPELDMYFFDDITNIPYERGLAAIKFFSELKSNCDEQYLKAQYQKTREVLHSKNIDIYEINRINELLGERLYKLPPMPGLIKRFASIVYFDKSENPTTYDFKYNMKKIKRWEKQFDDSFFLLMPIKTLLPALNESQENSKTFHDLLDQINNFHLDSLSLKQSEATTSDRSKAPA